MHDTLIMRRKTTTEITREKKGWIPGWIKKHLHLDNPHVLKMVLANTAVCMVWGKSIPSTQGGAGRVSWWRCFTMGQKAPSGQSGEGESMQSLTADYTQNAADFSPSHLQNKREMTEILISPEFIFLKPALSTNVVDCSFLRNICRGLNSKNYFQVGANEVCFVCFFISKDC